jgi:glycosyltransferase involved in cell wall biosynthesis
MRATKTPLNILAIAPLPFYRDGVKTFLFGGSVFYAELLPGLARRGHAIQVIAETPPLNDGEMRTGLDWGLPRLQVEWSTLAYRSGSTPPPMTYSEMVRSQITTIFERFVKQQQPDLVLLGRETIAGPLLSLCREHGLPTLLIAHGSPTSGLLHGSYPEDAQRQLIDTFRQVDRIAAVAYHLAEILRKIGVARVDVIPNIADPERFRPTPKDEQLLRSLDMTPEQTVVGYFSSLKPGKRPVDLIASAENVLTRYPQVVYIVGGTGASRAEMEELGKQKGIAEHVRYVGEVDHQRMPQYLNLADIVVLPSEREGAPLIYREAQACGRALLASDIPAAREMIEDGKTGLLFRLGDRDDLTAKLLTLIENRVVRQTLGEQARAAVAAQTLEAWIEAYEAVLYRVAQGCPSSR